MLKTSNFDVSLLAMDKEKIESLATKFSEKFAISMFKKKRKFCMRDLTHLDATPIFKILLPSLHNLPISSVGRA